jgi:hypothetical protein
MAFSGLVVGGSSCVGKTTLCRALSLRLALTHVETDKSLPSDARLQPLDGPPGLWDRAPEVLCGRLIRAAEAAIPYLMRQAEELSAAPPGWVLEGERVHPQLAYRLTQSRLARGVFVVETDAQRISRTLTERLPGFMTLSASRRRTVAEVDRLYNVWLMAESRRYDIACIESQPWSSLPDRLLEEVWHASTPG